ncbi:MULTISPECIES: glycosyltransferase family 4 protein [unclassified Pseudomonas]|uniref:glycosyltransferase family 4 protein n=1 Tax=unclassified Pseudomonas TaxID=196821 RepID=UPI001DC51BA4|nr:glycosyltransferase family 4 protein [Pseudomonas sp.]MPT00089.1 glycosyltransferase WbuB [Pseudomonas sp.]
MKILYVNPYAGGPGVGRYWRAYYLAQEWKKEGHDVTIVSPSFHHLMDGGAMPLGPSVHGGVEYHFLSAMKYSGNGLKRLLSMLSFAVVLLLFLIRLPRSKRPDLIIYSSAHPFAFPSAFIMAKLYKARIYFEVRDLWPLSLIEVAGVSVYHPIVWLLAWIERLAYKRSDRVISLLPGAFPHMEALGLTSDRFVYAPNGFSIQSLFVDHVVHPLLTDLQEFRRNGEFIYFYAGALGEPNAMHKFVDSLEYLPRSSVRKLRFVIVGKGEQAEEIRDRCDLHSYEFVSFYGQVDKSVILEALKCVDAGFFVMHDLPIYRFGISLNKLFDYMAFRLPIVAALHACNNPLIEARCGISVAPNRPKDLAVAFMSLATLERGELSQMGDRGRSYLDENFEYSVIAKKILLGSRNSP